MNAKLIPGPWAVERPYGEPGVYVTAADPRKTNPLICRLYEESEGCANLIAAAPELLEAAEQVAWKLSHNWDDGPARVTRQDATIRLLLAAITKATGGDRA